MLVRDKYWELRTHEGIVTLCYNNPENNEKSGFELVQNKDEIKSLYRLLRQVYD